MILIRCDLCGKCQEKPRGSPPKDWITYRKEQQVDLCERCGPALGKYLAKILRIKVTP